MVRVRDRDRVRLMITDRVTLYVSASLSIRVWKFCDSAYVVLLQTFCCFCREKALAVTNNSGVAAATEW